MNFSIVLIVSAAVVVVQQCVDTSAVRHGGVRGINWGSNSPPYWNPRYVTGRTREIHVAKNRSRRDAPDHADSNGPVHDYQHHAGHRIDHDFVDCEVGHRGTHNRDPGTHNRVRVHGSTRVDQNVTQPNALADTTQVLAVNETST